VTVTADNRDDLRIVPVRLRRSWGILVRRFFEVRPSEHPSLTFDPVVGESQHAAATTAFQQRAGHPQLERIRGVLVAAERERWDFHLVEVREREAWRFAGREIVVGPENNEMHLTRSAMANERRGPRR